ACGAAPEAPGSCVEVAAQALPGDSAFAARRFSRAAEMVEWMTRTIAPFPYERLDHVESATRFGGMENASAIFYAREPWRSGEMGEGVIAHETAHQWFGDAVTPASWRHLWLSEGFASYFGPLWFEAADGEEAFRERMEGVRRSYVESDAVDRPVLGPVPRNLYHLLDENAYEKGALVLHMLRGTLGDSAFFEGIRTYYREHRHGNARTSDLRRAMEASSGQELGWFFEQWLERPGYPRLEVRWWHTDTASGSAATRSDGVRRVALEFRQTQQEDWPVFRLPMDVELVGSDGNRTTVRVVPRRRADTIKVRTPATVEEVRLDPDDWVLMEARTRPADRADSGEPSGGPRLDAAGMD
ncbi:MAG: M1 family aminopeptidase, partial [Gemmatimonadota bacterium]